MNYKKEDLILLNMANVGKKKLEEFSSGELLNKIKIVKKEKERDLETELKLIKKHNVEVIAIFDKEYPGILKEIFSPPLVLYVKGQMLTDDEYGIAVVGSRIASIYGMSTAEKLSYELASRGVVVVSGLARGIDTASHRGALKAYGRTIAVLGNGLNSVYPPENKKIAEEIIERKGALVSEFPMKTEPLARNFPQRNRIINGLSLGVIVVEAAKNSGALITADFALDEGREVFAVPGKVDSPKSFGTNELIKQGAKLIQTAEDVIDELSLKLEASKNSKKKVLRPNLSGEEEAVYKNLSKEPKYVDELLDEVGLPLGRAMDVLFKLQLKKLVKELPGKNFVKI